MRKRWGTQTTILVAIAISAAAQAQPGPILVPPSVVTTQLTQMTPILVPPSGVPARPSTGAARVQPAPVVAQTSAVQVPPSVNQVPAYINQPALSAHASENVYLRPSLDSPGTKFVKFFREGEWYFSFGTSKQYWANTDIHVSQPSQGNDFVIHDVQAHDEPDASSMLTGNLFGPQYNIRIGRFINDKRTIAVELSLDHTNPYQRSDPEFDLMSVSMSSYSGVMKTHSQLTSLGYLQRDAFICYDAITLNAAYRFAKSVGGRGDVVQKPYFAQIKILSEMNSEIFIPNRIRD